LLWSQSATFAEVLGLLIEHSVPLDEAVTLAAAATGHRKLEASAARMATQIREGKPLVEIGQRNAAMPPLLMWLLAVNTPQAALAAALKNTAQNYRQRAIYRGELLKVYMPIVMSAAIGGTATLAYTMLLFVPWAALLHEISQP
jgi:type II secretory pathway component PulF